MPNKRKANLKISLVKDQPKTYKIDVEFDYQLKDLYKFLRENSDREVCVIINGKPIKFNSIAGKKRFAAGYEQGSKFALGHAKKLFLKMRKENNKLSAELKELRGRTDDDRTQLRETQCKLRVNDTVRQLRQLAAADAQAELNEDRALLSGRLAQVEPVIRLIRAAKGDGDLQKAFRLAKKLKA